MNYEKGWLRKNKLKNFGWHKIDEEYYCCLKGIQPLFERHWSMSKQSKACFYRMLVFSFYPTILSRSIWRRKMMCYPTFGKKFEKWHVLSTMSDWINFIFLSNWFSSRILNWIKVYKAWSLVCIGKSHVNLVWSSTKIWNI